MPAIAIFTFVLQATVGDGREARQRAAAAASSPTLMRPGLCAAAAKNCRMATGRSAMMYLKEQTGNIAERRTKICTSWTQEARARLFVTRRASWRMRLATPSPLTGSWRWASTPPGRHSLQGASIGSMGVST